MDTIFCNICNAELLIHFSEVIDPQTQEKFSIYKCVKCGLGHTIPQPTNLSYYYGSSYYGGRHSFTATYCAKRRLRIITSLVGRGENKKLLDVGCGDGTFLLTAKRNGWNVVGTEMNPQIARNNGLIVKESIEDIFNDAPFDCITLWHSLEHFKDPRSTLINLSKLLKINGVIVIAVPNAGGLQARMFSKKWFHLDVPRHLYHFDKNSLHYIMNLTELKVEKEWHQEFEYDLLGWTQSALNNIFSTPNIFFNSLTGRTQKVNKTIQLLNFLLGVIFSIFSLPLVAIGTILHQGGTLIISARRIKE